MKKHIICILLIITLPYVFCVLGDLFSDRISIGQGGNSVEQHLLNKKILLEINGLYKDMDVEEYLLGVLPGTVSAEYDLETLKVQAILIRTNILKEMDEKGSSDAADLSYDYLTVEEQIDIFGERNYEKYRDKFEQAVVETAGMVIRQEGNLIMALYHEVSIGKTADAKEVLGEEIAYLKSVDSGQDVEAKHYMNIVSFTWAELAEQDEANPQEMAVDNAESQGQEESKQESAGQKEVVNEEGEGEKQDDLTEKLTIQVTESSENGFVKQVSVNGTIYTGEEIMEKYNLKSNHFYVEETNEGIRFVCLGKGNCLGLSQYGANCMALEGKSAKEIIRYYYTKVSVELY
ncbi:MAG: SpoIID/LytB domain-containing protein [Lachnospiraceae bacterium]|nr:SpoIID/LytB domain-containing protein [Lachnospiraceae bacterium]